MIPYIKYLFSLFLYLKDDDEAIRKNIISSNLPYNEKIIELSYDRFINSLGEYSNSFINCLYLDFTNEEFSKILKQLNIINCFIFQVHSVSTKISSDPLIKTHVECCLLNRIKYEDIICDISKIYKVDINEHEIIDFSTIFFDINEINSTNSWMEYVDTLPVEEKNFKIKCKAGGADYTRWALGAKVDLDALEITKDMITDSYFKFREASIDKSMNSVDSAIKWGGLATKLIDRAMKLELLNSSEPDDESIREALGRQLCMFDLKKEKPKMIGELINETQVNPKTIKGPDPGVHEDEEKGREE